MAKTKAKSKKKTTRRRVKKEEPKTPVGAPTKYDPKFCQQIIEHGRQGGSVEAFAGKIEVSKQTIYNWCNSEHESFHPEFLDAKEVSEALAHLWWENQGIQCLTMPEGTKFTSTVWSITMKNRFGYRDKTQHSTLDGRGKETGIKLTIRNYTDSGPEST